MGFGISKSKKNDNETVAAKWLRNRRQIDALKEEQSELTEMLQASAKAGDLKQIVTDAGAIKFGKRVTRDLRVGGKKLSADAKSQIASELPEGYYKQKWDIKYDELIEDLDTPNIRDILKRHGAEVVHTETITLRPA